MDQKLRSWLDRFFITGDKPNCYTLNPELGLASKIDVNILGNQFIIRNGVLGHGSQPIGQFFITDFNAMLNEMRCTIDMFVEDMVRNNITEDLQLWFNLRAIVSFPVNK